MDPAPGYMGKKVCTESRDKLRKGGFIDNGYELFRFDLKEIGWPGQDEVGKDMDCGVYVCWYISQIIIKWKEYRVEHRPK